MAARSRGFRSLVPVALFVFGLPVMLSAQIQAHVRFPFVREDRTLGEPSPSIASLVLRRTCRMTLSITGATRADVRGWKFRLGDVTMTELGLPGNESQPAEYGVRVPSAAPDPIQLTLDGASEAATASLGTVSLRTEDLAEGEACQAPVPRDTRAGPSRRPSHGFPPVYDRSRRMANLRFDRFGLPDTTVRGAPEKFPAGLTDNDAITVLLDIPDSIEVNTYSVQVTGNIKGDEVNIVGAGDLGGLPMGRPQGLEAEAASVLYSMGVFGPYSAPQVTIRIVRTVGDETLVDRSYTLRVRPTYIAALRLGVARSGVRFTDFQAGPRSPSDTTRIIRDLNEGRDREVRPYLTLVFYGWRFWERGFWDGRDIEAEPRTADRLNPMVGAGLEDLGDEWLFGLSLEVARGLDVNLAYQAAKVSVLQSGFLTGGVFSGTAGPPTSEEWRSGVTVGASVDLRVAASALSGLLSSGK